MSLQQQQLLHNGKKMKNFETPSSLGVTDGGLVMMVSNTSSMVSSNGVLNPDGSALNPAAYQQQIRNNSDLMAQLLQSDPELAQIIIGNDLNKLQELLRRRHNQRTELRRLIEAEMALLYADPFDVEAQKKIEAAIRQKGIDENQVVALERVVMLYVDMEVNGVPVKAFVNTGAESTILSKSCAERLGLLRLLDERYKGIAHGVGQSEILGRIHVAEIKIGNNFYPCSFVVSDSPDMEFVFGLDMLRKHQCTIDLKDNVLRVGGGEVTLPFLPEEDIPRHDLDGEKQLNEASISGTGGSFGSAAERSNTPTPSAGSDHGGLSHDHPSIIDPSNQPTSSALQIDMARGVCRIRNDDEYYEPDFLYGDTTRTMFTMKIFHGGEFSKHPGRAYTGGKVSYVDYVEVDKFDKDELGEVVRSMGYPCDMVLHFHYKEPCLCLDLGIKPLCDDVDFQKLFDIVRGGTNLVEVYVEHGQTRVITDAPFSSYFPVSNETTLIKFTESRDEEECSENDSYESESERSKDDDPDYIQEFDDNDNHVEDLNIDYDADEHEHEHDNNIVNGGEINDDKLNFDIDDFDSDEEKPNMLKSVARKIRRKQVTHASDTCPFYVGQLIETKEKLHEMVKKYAVSSRRDIFIKKNDPLRFRVVCLGSTRSSHEKSNLNGQKVKKRSMKPTCPWTLHISRRTVQDHWCVKTLRYQHQCFESSVIGLYTMRAIAKDIEATIDTKPHIPVKELREEIQKKHKIHVSEGKMRKAKLLYSYKKDGDFRKQYGMLNKYCEELLRANPGTTVQIDVEPCCDPSSVTRQFRRIYICYGGMKSGFKMCGREILGLSRCSMEDPFPGQILTAVGIDGNNGIYPVAFALVEAETEPSWTWFLKCLGDDLDLPTNASFTFISDGQKGLIPALERVFPNAEHRYCLKHIHKNMKKQWCGDVFKTMLLRAASATSLPYYINAMEEIKKADTSLFAWLEQIPAKSWSRAHFSGSAKCDILLNNICDEFNKQLVGATDKPVITCLEYIREYMTKRIVNVRMLQADAAGPLTPYAQSLFETIQSEASQLTVMMVDDATYQVNGVGTTQCVVHVELRTCTCRKWDLTAMPCKHVVAAIRNMAENGMDVGVPENWVDEAYWLDTWKKVYANQINAIPGPDMWTSSECTTTLTPPKHHEQNGTPNKKRKKSSLDARCEILAAEKKKKSIEEVERVFSSGGQMTRKGHFKTCQKCGHAKHNVRTCKAVSGTGTSGTGTSLQIDVTPVSDCL